MADVEQEGLELFSKIYLNRKGKLSFKLTSTDFSLFERLFPHEESFHFLEQILYSDASWQVVSRETGTDGALDRLL